MAAGRRDAWLVALLLVAGLALRLYRIDEPLWERHAWKQADLAAIARNYSEGDRSLFHPRVDWRGDTAGYAEMEFPLVPYLAALLNRSFGERELWGRLLNVAAGLTLALVLFLYGRMRMGRGPAFGALIFALFSPLAWFFSRTYMQELAGWCFALLALWQWDRALDPVRPPSWRPLAGSSLCLAFALLCKLNTAVVLLPMAAVLWERRGRRRLFDRRLAFAAAMALLPPLFWYWHAHALFRQTGLTFGILGNGHDKFQTLTYLVQPEWWLEIASRVARNLITLPGLVLIAAGLPALTRDHGARPFLAWGIAAVIFTLIVAEGSLDMEYYQLVLVVPAAVLFGLGASALWKWGGGRLIGPTLLLIAAFVAMGSRRGVAMMEPRYGRQYATGQALAKWAAPGDRVVNLGAYTHHEGGDDYEPNVFYYSRTHGWVLRGHEYRVSLVDSLRLRGARFAVTGRLHEMGPYTAFLDSMNARFPVVDSTAIYRVWALTPSAPRRGNERR